ncbi:variant erythrocyte surface antigen-1, beta subunit [Babesia divergens]|uniref:Variant erythrocyte surface antigen-1, beta subunit n=1 Tax=Babesia divergens TaxID=32595 RepID=A0AAD9GJ72_BABDI|nr:variant erythrocyte surface antigen-1, beta subunit [Babesia divergens]
MAAAAADPGLLRCPKNLKECIDWVLRATGKDNGSDNINNLKNALKAELGSSGLTDELETQLKDLASGLGFLAGLPACLCKTKKSVEEGLQKIYEELENFNYCKNFDISKLNCDLCKSNLYPCKCCVIQSIKDVKGCQCIKGRTCHCKDKDVSCAKVLAGLEACLHLQCLQADMNEICQCSGSECCKGKQCDGNSKGPAGVSCDFCLKLKSNTPVPTTGLGLSPPNPIRLAEKLEKFFGSGGTSKNGCKCQCGSNPDKSCCCLACPDNKKCFESCSAGCGSKGCSSQHSPSQCPCKTFCQNINGIKIAAEAGDRTCCDSGHKCHCEVDSNCTASSSSGQGLNCCIENSGGHYKHSLKCMIRRLVLYFKDLKSDISSPSKENFKNCCELLCVLKTCEFLDGYLKDTSKAKKFYHELETLRFAGPCGQELWRTLDSFLNFIRYVFYPKVKDLRLEYTIKEARNSCDKCQNSSGKHSSCNGCKSGTSSCPGCTAVLKELQTHKDVLSLMTRGYSSAYSEASWNSLTSSSGSGSKCCGSLSSPSCGCPSSGCSSSGSSCPSQCCPDCPQKKAAKIFLGFLPCMYWGLKILYDRAQDPLTWPDWQYISMDYNDKPSSGLAKFLQALGYGLDPLKTKKGFDIFPILGILYGSDKIFENLYNFVSLNYFVPSRSLSSGSSKSQPSPPSTVRQMLLWLYGLRFQKSFPSLVENCKSLSLPLDNAFHPDAVCYYIHTCCFLLPVSFISTVQHSDSHVGDFFLMPMLKF